MFFARKSCEDSIATTDWEYRFKEAIGALLESLSIPVNHRLNPDSLEEVELHIENSATEIDQDNLELLKALSNDRLTILLISDFYHSSSWLQALLRLKGIGHLFFAVYSSSDRLLNKRTGSIFEHIKSSHSYDYSEWLHVGDNSLSDHEIPSSKGIQTLLVESSRHEAQSRSFYLGIADHINSSKPFLHSHRIKNILKKAVSDLRIQTIHTPESLELFESGLQASAILAGFILKIIEDGCSVGSGHIYFFSREGIFFEDLYKIAIEEDVYDLAACYPTSSVLRVSRAATFAASLREPTLTELMRIWNLYSRQSIESFSKSLNLDIAKVSDLVKKHNLSMSEQLQYPWENPKFLRLFHDVEFGHILAASVKDQKHSLLRYLSSQGISRDSTSKLHIVDIGWRGTIQDNISYLFPDKQVHGTYLGLDRFLNKQPCNCTKTGYLCNNNSENLGDHLTLGDVAVLEFITNAPGGSVTGYSQLGEPHLKTIPGEESIILKEGKIIQDGIQSGARLIFQYAKRHGLTSADLTEIAGKAYFDIKNNPSAALADAFNSLHHNETFGTGASHQILDMSSLKLDGLVTPAELHTSLFELWHACRWKRSFLNSTRFQNLVNTCKPSTMLSFPREIYSNIYGGFDGAKLIICMPPPIRGSGGHRTILNLAKGLSKAGCEVDIQLEEFNNDIEYIYSELEGFDVNVTQWWQPNSVCDIAIATVGHSPEFVATCINAKSKYYFIQDFEAAFNPVSDTFVNIENSYAYGLTPLCIGSWMAHLLSIQFDIKSFYAGLGVDTNIYKLIRGHERKNSIAFLYQPEKHRRLSFICIKALEELKQAMPDVEIISYGSEPAPPSDCISKHLGLVSDLTILNQLYNTCAAGLCISLTNPSRIPFEMMAAGCIPVDVYRYNNLFDYPDGTAILAYQDSYSLAKSLEDLLLNSAEIDSRRINCINYARPRSICWEVDTLVNSVHYSHYNVHVQFMDSPTPRYTEPPTLAGPLGEMKHAKNYCKWQHSLASL